MILFSSSLCLGFSQDGSKNAATDTVVKGKVGKALDSYMQKLAEEKGAAGAVIVSRAGKIILKKGYGFANRTRQIPNTPKTLFDAGSIPKTFTAAAVFKLAEGGKLKLDDRISKYFSGAPDDKKEVTIRHLLSHTSGLESYHSDGDFEDMSREEAVRRCLALKLRWVPGQKEGYSNAGYILLAALIEQLTGKSFDDYVAQVLFKSAGMNHTFGYRKQVSGTAATGYIAGQDKGTSTDWLYTWSLRGTGGMLSDATDLHRWMLNISKILNKKSMDELYRPVLKKWTMGGWERFNEEGRTLLVKGGVNDFGFSGQIRRYVEDDVLIVFLLNSRPENATAFHQKEIGPALSDIVLDRKHVEKKAVEIN